LCRNLIQSLISIETNWLACKRWIETKLSCIWYTLVGTRLSIKYTIWIDEEKIKLKPNFAQMSKFCLFFVVIDKKEKSKNKKKSLVKGEKIKGNLSILIFMNYNVAII
jgi:hypothetical protein